MKLRDLALGALAVAVVLWPSTPDERRARKPRPARPSLPVGNYPPLEGARVVQTRTPLSRADATEAIAWALDQIAPDAPPSALALLVAQSAVETDGWASMYNYNFGNWTVPASAPHWAREVREVADDGSETTRYQRFASSADAPAGALAWLRRLADGWPEAWAALLSGATSAEYAAALKRGVRGEYYTAAAADYTRALELRLG